MVSMPFEKVREYKIHCQNIYRFPLPPWAGSSVLWGSCVGQLFVFTRPLLPEWSSLQVGNLSVCTSSPQHFCSMAFKSSQNHVRPHILFIIGKRRTWAMTMTMFILYVNKRDVGTHTPTRVKCFHDLLRIFFEWFSSQHCDQALFVTRSPISMASYFSYLTTFYIWKGHY